VATASLILGVLGLLPCVGPLGAIPAVICGHIARSRIKAAGGAAPGGGPALAGTVLGYVSLALMIMLGPVYAAILIPAFAKERNEKQLRACVSNLLLLDAAKEKAAAAARLGTDDAVPEAQVEQHLNGGSLKDVVCPSGGWYTLNPVGRPPECAVHGPLSAPHYPPGAVGGPPGERDD